VRAKSGERERGGEKFHVGSGNKIAVGVFFEEGFSRLRVDDDQAPIALVGRRGGQQRVRALTKTQRSRPQPGAVRVLRVALRGATRLYAGWIGLRPDIWSGQRTNGNRKSRGRGAPSKYLS